MAGARPTTTPQHEDSKKSDASTKVATPKDAIVAYPKNWTRFSPPELLALGGGVPKQRPRRVTMPGNVAAACPMKHWAKLSPRTLCNPTTVVHRPQTPIPPFEHRWLPPHLNNAPPSADFQSCHWQDYCIASALYPAATPPCANPGCLHHAPGWPPRPIEPMVARTRNTIALAT
uniref:Uncharacterized protein n=1 Tax=Oryza punctata TaxID=4537 RepID=A0A0E0LTD1_ORYPU